MNISSRQRMILDILLDHENGITVKEIADEVEVSSRTIHRELEEIEIFLQQYHLKLVKRAGVGILMEGDLDAKEELRLSLINVTTLNFTADERKVMILCLLLGSTEPIKLVSLAYDLKVTPATISHDLDDLEDWIQKYDLSLIRKRGYGVELQGKESFKRKAISNLISDHLNELELIGLIKENIQGKSSRNIDSISERLLGLIEKEKLIMVENALRNLEKEWPYPLADSAYIGLVIHLALAMERIKKGERIKFDENYLQELKGTQEYKVAAQILERLEMIFQMEIPADEIGYITMHLRGAKLRNSQNDPLQFSNAEFVAKIMEFIRYCEDKLDTQFSRDSSLLYGLLTHMEPALFRIQRNMKIRNPLLDQIKANYGDLFRVIQEAVKVVFSNIDVPEEETGYLVMHFGAALERTSEKEWDYRALIVCSSGIGSSKILATRIEKEIPEIVEIRNVSLFDIDHIPKREYDMIISTIPLLIEANKYILVSPLLTKEDIQKIKLYMRGIKVHRSDLEQLKPKLQNNPLEKLKSMKSYFHHIIDIIEGFDFPTISIPYEHTEEIINHICNLLHQKKIIKNKEKVVKQLLEREKLSGIGIPNTGLALFHGRNDQMTQVSFTIHHLMKPIWMRSMENKQIEIENIVMLLGPKEITKEGLEVLSHISALLIDDETIDALKTQETKIIADYFSKKLYEYCYDLMQ
ncbi:MAG TPA: BglG family transcription antiterminator [Bacillota bacterium]|nr:BglG family transcription antiterminator [Bacillota bacterium]